MTETQVLPPKAQEERRRQVYEKTLAAFTEDPWLAHASLFSHRHQDEHAPAHQQIVEDLWRKQARWNIEGFRGIGKTTYAEEAVLLRALLKLSRNFIIVGASWTRACERLEAIKFEALHNPMIEQVFGSLKGHPWQEDKIVLANGACIQALGRDQSTLGIKYLDARPDGFLIDDVEDPQEKRSDPEREETFQWLRRTFLPALDNPTRTWGRHLGTRRGTGSMCERLERELRWGTSKYPIEYLDESGTRTATWEAKFPLPEIDRLRDNYRSDLATFDEEYMCRAGRESMGRVFTRDILKIEARPRPNWAATYAMYDPARTVGRKAATTGRAVWSYDGPRIRFWLASAHEWMPDEIVADLFKMQEIFQPTWIGFEEDGLNEWARQPIRTEMLKRRIMLPLKPVRAPKGKIDFIKGLQFYMAAGEITFCGEEALFSDALDQFLSFPRGRIDAPNACAYALLLRPGAPVYDFPEEAISEILAAEPSAPSFLAANSDGAVVTAALVQRVRGELRVLADWVREGSCAEIVPELHQEAALAADTYIMREVTEYGQGDQQFKLPLTRIVQSRTAPRWVVPAWHQEQYRNVGLTQAIRKLPATLSLGGRSEAGQAALAGELAKRVHGSPGVRVSPRAFFTLRAFAGGYARPLDARGVAAAQPDAGLYRVLMEGLESFAAIGTALDDDQADQQPIAYTKSGIGYRSALPNVSRETRGTP